jgi:hypothetical protein
MIPRISPRFIVMAAVLITVVEFLLEIYQGAIRGLALVGAGLVLPGLIAVVAAVLPMPEPTSWKVIFHSRLFLAGLFLFGAGQLLCAWPW